MAERPSGFSDAPIEIVSEQSKWPAVIGVVSILYAIAGLLCSTGPALMTAFLMDVLAPFIGEADVPPVIRIQSIVTLIVVAVLGIMLLVGGAGTLRRRRSGVRWLKRWSIARLVCLVVMFPVALVTMPAGVAMQVQMTESRNERLREQGQEQFIREVDEATLTRQSTIMAAAMTGLAAIYPAFLGLFLSRRKVEEELEDWDP